MQPTLDNSSATPKPALSPDEERAVLSAALREVEGPDAVLESWSADPLSKHGRRRVIRYDVRARVPGAQESRRHLWVGKFYDREDDARTVAGVLTGLATMDPAAGDGLIVPRVLAVHPPLRLVLHNYEAGESVVAAMGRRDGEVEEGLGRALAKLHRSDVRVEATTTPADVLERLRAKVADLSARFPEMAPALQQVLAMLESRTPSMPEPRFLHGDLGAAQLLWREGRVVMLDFDECTRGDPALDLGTLLAQLRRLSLRNPGKIGDFNAVRSAVLSAYLRAAPADLGLPQRVAWYEVAALVRKIHFLVFDTTRHAEPEAIERRQAEALRLMALLPQPSLGSLPHLVALSEARAGREVASRPREKKSTVSQRAAQRDRRRRLRRFYGAQLGRVKWRLLLAGLCTLGSSVTDLLQPWPLKLILDHGLLEKPLPDYLWFLEPTLEQAGSRFLILASLAMVGVAVMGAVFSYLQKFITSAISYQTVYALRRELFAHMQRLPLSFHTGARAGDLLSRVQSDTDTLKDMVSDDLLKFSSQGLSIVGMGIILMVIDVRLALIALATLPLLSFSLFHLYRKSKVSAKKQKQQDGKVAARMVEVLSAIPLVQAFGREGHEEERFDAVTSVSLRESIRVSRLSAAASRSSEILTSAGTAAAVLYGALQVQSGRMLPGVLVLVVAYLNNFYKPLRSLAKLSTDFSKAMASADRLSEVLDIEPRIRDRADATEAPRFRGEIEFRNVSFAYDETDDDVLGDVSFHVAPGQRVALVGVSGAGKSTIGNLILRLYEPRQGAVLVDGVDVQRYTRESLRRQIGVVLQNSILFGSSVKENIAYGNPEASEEEIEAAARAANADEFIRELPQGYDTVIGERGSTLSGGQQQRIAIARALIRDAPILILDEPMTGLDVESEAKVREALDRLMAGRTCIMMTHDLQSIAGADVVLVLDGGGLAARGTHAELLATSDRYRELYELDRAQSMETPSP